MVDSARFFAKLPRVTTGTRNWLITFSILASPFLFFLGLLIFWTAEPLPPIAPLPVTNGYDGLAKAGQMVTADAGDYNKMDEAQLGKLVARNAEALQLLRAAFSNQCRVPVQFSQAYLENHGNELARFKRLAQILAAEGRRAEWEEHPGDAAKSYLDAIHLGNESARGGVVIDQLVGTAIEHLGTDGLQKIAGQLDAKSCRETAAALEILDSQRQTWSDVMQQERSWSRRTFPGIRNEFVRVMTRNSLNKAFQQAEEKFNQQQKRTRQLTIDLAARAYELEKGHAPASAADLAPDYLKAVPQGPVTGTNTNDMPP